MFNDEPVYTRFNVVLVKYHYILQEEEKTQRPEDDMCW